ncbi:NAD-glutamate dehydrogenase [bacterium]|nr:NAD-glutamate dehydrogenase [bacterium]
MEKPQHILSISRQKEELLRTRVHEINTHVKNDPSVANKRAMSKFVEILCPKLPIEILKNTQTDQLYSFLRQRYQFVEASFTEKVMVSVSPYAIENTDNGHTTSVILDLILKDRHFIVDSLVEYIHSKKHRLSLIAYPVINIRQTEDNKLSEIDKISDDTANNYVFCCCIIENFNMNEQSVLKEEVLSVLQMLRSVTDDFAAMTDVVESYSYKDKKDQTESLMESERRRLFNWFNEGNVILLGSGELDREDISETLSWDQIMNPLGYIRRKKEINDTHLPAEIGRLGSFFLESGLNINTIELNEFSMVHRRERIQLVFRRKRDPNVNVKIVFLYILFTNKSYKAAAMAIPLARLKVNAIMENAIDGEVLEERHGHQYKIAHDFFNMIPKSELFRLDRNELSALFQQFMYFGDFQRTKLSIFTQPSRRYARLTFCLPSNRFSEELFVKIDQLLGQRLTHSSEIKYWFSLGRNAYSHHIFWFPQNHPQLEGIELDAIEKEVASLTLGWEEDFQAQLGMLPPEQRKNLPIKYANVFQSFYQALYTPQDAIKDIQFIEKLLATNREQVDLRTDSRTGESQVYFFSKKLYHLTEIMPHLQNLSLIVIDENTYKLKVQSDELYIYTYYVKSLKDQESKFENFNLNFCELLLAVLEDTTENDVLNGLLLSAGLNRQEINLFILYRNYYWQIGAPYLPVNQSFLKNPAVIDALKNLFTAKFSPSADIRPLSRDELEPYENAALKAIEQVKTVAEDIIFKTIFNLIQATIRTNYFDIDEYSAMAVKIESAKVNRMPSPKPLYEIYVHGTHLEGIHLRGAMIARGGLRHSDRPSDFRSEVLGLMHTQMLKNVVIVPEGSKGGFITKRHVQTREDRIEEVKTQYKRYINSLLSLTDNIVAEKVVPARNIVRYDGDDPYLVVAADKGTAALSDTANEISYQRGFWLKDAFASGGKHGYDHKGMAITARGAWEGVKLHFLQEGKDIQKTEFTVIGIGDMSGDVFGNGMLLSRFICLIGAFNHIYIMVDPDPDPEKSYQERQRLFNTPGSNWMDYNAAYLSPGGGVFDRFAKSIPLTPEIKKRVGTTADSVSGEELIRLLLKCNVDLLWNGGIGTYIKSHKETHSQVGDATNDAVRIDARDLRVKVIGEGGNLGLTQLARQDAAVAGVRLNTDAIDNSGGVDTSDHEVNMKILMDYLLSSGQIPSLEARNQLLEDLTDDVAELVLQDNRAQGQIISMDNARSKKDINPILDVINLLTRKKYLDPNKDILSSKEQLEEYFTNGIGIPRPDLAILLSYTKMHFYKELINSDALNNPLLNDVYYSYFPQRLREDYDITQYGHPLKKEIIGTVLVNKTINQAGITLLPDILAIVDVSPVDIIVGYTILNRVFNLDSLRDRVRDELQITSINSAYTLLINIEKFIYNVLIWKLICYAPNEIQFSMIQDFEEMVKEYQDKFEQSMDPEESRHIQNTCENLMTLGISPELARDLSRGEFLRNSMEVIDLVKKCGISLENSITLSQGIDSLFHFKKLNSRLMHLELESPWGKKHRSLLLKQLHQLKHAVSKKILNDYATVTDFEDKLNQFRLQKKEAFKSYQIDYNNLLSADSFEMCGVAILFDKITHILK